MSFSKSKASIVMSALLVILTMMFASFAAGAAEQPGKGVTINMGKASWSSAEPKAAVLTLLFEELGYRVNGPMLFASNPLAYLAIANGDLDVWPNGWFPTHYPQLPRNFDATAEFAGTICEGCTLEGYLVNNEAIEEFGITTLADFKRPEVKAAFDANNDGKADLFGCPPGWGCHETIEFHLDAFDLRDHINHVTADYTAGFADALTRARAGEPVLYYTWTPNDTILLLVPGEDVQWIGVPNIIKAPSHEGLSEDALIATGLKGAVTDPLPLGFVAGSIHIVANKAFVARNPAAAELMSHVKLDLQWISEATKRITDGENSAAEIRAIAAEWIEANRDTVDEWLEAARAAAR